MKYIKIKIVKCDIWEGLYIDDLLEAENYSIDAYIPIKRIQDCWLSKNKPVVSSYHIDDDWIKERGSLPCYFHDIPEDKLELRGK